MKNVLFIDYFFPPLAADWRGTAFARLLPKMGWKLIVLSADSSVRYDKDYDLLNVIPKDTTAYRVGHYEAPMEWQYIRQRMKIAIDFPDSYKHWCRPAYNTAKNILKKEKIDLIYSASPTFATAFVAMRLKKEFGIPWVADFLDGWAVNDFLLTQNKENLIRPLFLYQNSRIIKGEKALLKTASKVTVIHPHVKYRWEQAYKDIDINKIDVITDGYDETAFQSIRPNPIYSDALTITFLGSFYPDFKEPIKDFASSVVQIDNKIKFITVGRAASAVQQMNLPNTMCILHRPREEAFSFALGSDFLFLVMPSYAKWTPTKTYDYLRIGKPILALVPEDGDAAKIIKEAKAGFVLSYDRERMREQLKEIFDQYKNRELKAFNPDQDYIKQFERTLIAEKMVNVFNSLVS